MPRSAQQTASRVANGTLKQQPGGRPDVGLNEQRIQALERDAARFASHASRNDRTWLAPGANHSSEPPEELTRTLARKPASRGLRRQNAARWAFCLRYQCQTWSWAAKSSGNRSCPTFLAPGMTSSSAMPRSTRSSVRT